MYFLQQIKTQFTAQLASYNDGRGVEGPRDVDTSPVVEGPKSPDEIRDEMQVTGKDAHEISTKMKFKGANLQAGVDELEGREGTDKSGGKESNDGDKVNSMSLEEKREAVIARLEADGELTEGMDEATREELILAGLEATDTETPMTEEEIQARDEKHQEILEYAKSLGLEGLNEEEVQNVFGDMTQEEIAEFEAMSPEEQTAFMLGRSEALLAANEAILAAKEAELKAERSAGVSPQREAEIRYEQTQIQSARSAINGRGPGNTGFFRGGGENAMIPGGEAGTLTPEQLAEFGPMGGELAAYALTCRPATNEKYYCGKNTGEMLNSYYRSIGKPELQINDRPRHGYVWASLLASRPDQFREINVTAENAPVGCLISYAAGPGGSSAFAQYGHIETKCAQDKYHFGQVASSPGGSKRPPQQGEYRVFMPITQIGQNSGMAMS